MNTKIINGLSNEFTDHVIQGQVKSTKIVTILRLLVDREIENASIMEVRISLPGSKRKKNH